MAKDDRPIDDPALLAEQARENIEKQAADLRAKRVAIDTEPPTVFRPRDTMSERRSR